jgi:hypothetical protein
MSQERTIGIGALLAIAAAIGISFQSGSKPGAGESSRRGETGIQRTQHKSTACDNLREHLEDFLDAEGKLFPTPCDASAPESPSSESHADLKFVIATLPDPIHTHLSLSFDESTAAIQEAVQDEGYDFDSSWLPWGQEKENGYTHLSDQKQADNERNAREDQPGVLLFRKTSADDETPRGVPDGQGESLALGAGPSHEGKTQQPEKSKQQPEQVQDGGTGDRRQAWLLTKYKHGLVIFVVGEDATHGIHRQQFQNAVQWIEMLSLRGLGRGDRVMILGPSFSGSFESLAELLLDQKIAAKLDLKAGEGRALPVYAGAVSGPKSAKWFRHKMNEEYGEKPPRVLFHSFVWDDEQIVGKFLTHMKTAQPGFDASRVAILSEDETAYGMDVGDQSGVLTLYYPRDISALRSAYQSKSLFDNPSTDESQTPRRNLPTDLADPTGIVHDSIHTYGSNQTPLAQEAFLLQIINALREAGIRYILLRGSNPLDQLFLTDFLRRFYPDGRLVILTTNLLFIRERGATGLGGVMTLSTYPLSSLARHWTERPPLPASDRAFSSDGSEALYNALRLLLNADYADRKHPKSCHVREPDGLQDGGGNAYRLFLPPVDCTDKPISDYAPPLWIFPSSCTETTNARVCTYPGPDVWLSVIGANRFWPLVPLTSEVHETGACDKSNQPSRGILGLPLLMKLALLALLGFSVFHFFCCARGSYMAKPSFRAYFAASNDPKQLTLVCLGSTLLAALGIVTAWSCGIFHFPNVVMPYSLYACGCALAIEVLAWRACLLYCRRIDQLHSAPAPPKGGSAVASLESGPTEANETRPAAVYRRLRKWAGTPRFRTNFTLVVPTVGMLLMVGCFVVPLESGLLAQNRVLTYWRSMNLASGLSPVVPFLSLLIGLYATCWFSLHGLALFGPDRPRLPRPKQLAFQISPHMKRKGEADPREQAPENQRSEENSGRQVLRMFTQEAADDIEFAGKPLAFARRLRIRTNNADGEKTSIQLAFRPPLGLGFFFLFAAMGFGFANSWVPIRTLGHENYALVFLAWFLLSASLMVAICWRMYQTWSQVRQLLEYLDRMPLRRTMEALRGFSWGSVWRMSGNVLEVRYKLISRQLECMNHTITSLRKLQKTGGSPVAPASVAASLKCLEDMDHAGQLFAKWYLENYTNALAGDLTAFRKFQKRVANVCGCLLQNLLFPSWKAEAGSLVLVAKDQAKEEGPARQIAPLAKQEYVRNAEEFVCLTYLGFVQNILGRLRTMAISIVVLFVSCGFAISSYPFDPRQALSAVLIALFGVSSLTLVFVYAGMHRDATLSHVTNTTPGELGSEFWFKLLVFVAPPLFGLLARVFPGITDFLFSWLQPGLSSLK